MFGRRITSCSNTIGDAYPACGAGGKHRHTPVEEGVTGYSTADRLLHSSPVPVAITPRRYRCYTDRLTRLSCGYSATSGSVDVVRR
ncbi:universal stress protein, partial [Mycobacterium tuberculosis XTB13-110]